MADVVNNEVNLMDDFEKELNEAVADEAAVAEEQVAFAKEKDLAGFAGCFAEWDILPTDLLK